jgi:WD40 repeat protein
VRGLAFSPGGRTPASIGREPYNTVAVWTVATGMALCGCPAAHDSVTCITWLHSTDALSIVTGGHKTMRVWELDPVARKVRPTEISFGKNSRDINCIAVEPGDEYIYFGTASGDVFKVHIAAKQYVALGPRIKFSLGISTICVHPSGALLVGSGGGEVAALDPGNLEPKLKQKVLGGVSSLAMDAMGDFLFLGTTEANMYLVKYEGLIAELKTTCHTGMINDLTFPHGSAETFATCSGSDIRVWHARTLSELLRIQVPNLECNAIAFLKSGTAIVSGWNDGKVRAFFPQSGRLMYVICDAHKVVGTGNSSGGAVPRNGVTAITPSNDCKRLVTGGADGQVRVWAVAKETQVMIASMKEHKGPVYAIAIKANDSQCISASADGSCILWALDGENAFVRINALFASNFFKAAAYHPDESQLITCGSDRKVTYWDVANLQQIRILDGSNAEINSVSTNASGTLFASGGADKKVVVWHYDSGLRSLEGAGHSGAVTKVRFAPDEQSVVSVGTEGGIFVWGLS